MNEEKRLKKERKVLRGIYTVRVPDGVTFEKAQEQLDKFFRDSIGQDVEDHVLWAGWKKRG